VFPPGTLHGDLFARQKMTDPTEYQRKVNQTLRAFGAAWQFNEIVGYVRLHFVGTQIRGEYAGPNRTRIVRSRSRSWAIESQTWKLAPEVEIGLPISKDTITTAIRRYVADCRRELPRRYIDTEVFETLLPHIDWVSVFSTE